MNAKISKRQKEALDRIDRCMDFSEKRKNSEPSPGELRIISYLNHLKIKYEREKYFGDCYSPITNHILYFDFYLPEYNLIIEYDGRQHFGKKVDDRLKIHDRTKNIYCRKKRINLLRIPYSKHKKIEPIIEYKILELSSVRTKILYNKAQKSNFNKNRNTRSKKGKPFYNLRKGSFHTKDEILNCIRISSTSRLSMEERFLEWESNGRIINNMNGKYLFVK